MQNFYLKKYTAIIIALIMLTLSGCHIAEPKSEKLSVVCVIFPQYDFARAVGKNLANVHMIMKPGAEIHGFEPSAADIQLISNADVFVCGGGESDVWIDNIFESLDTSKITIVRLMDYVDLLEEENPTNGAQHSHEHSHNEACESHGHAGYDEHIWTSPENAALCVDAICDAMSEKDSDNADSYRANANEYIGEILKADAEIENVAENGRSDFSAVGDRFPFLYMTRKYGLQYAAVFSGCSPENDANPSVIVNMIETMKAKKTPVVFYTELSDRKMARTISEETGAKMLMLHSCQSVSKADFDSGKTYVDYMIENAKALKEALS